MREEMKKILSLLVIIALVLTLMPETKEGDLKIPDLMLIQTYHILLIIHKVYLLHSNLQHILHLSNVFSHKLVNFDATLSGENMKKDNLTKMKKYIKDLFLCQ